MTIFFFKKLKVIVWNLINKKTYTELFIEQKIGKRDVLNSRTLNNADNRKKYLNSIDEAQVKKAEVELANSLKKEKTLLGEEIRVIETKQGSIRKTKTTSVNEILFGRKLELKIGPINNLYCALDDIYERFKNDLKFEHKLPIIGMSLRLILDIASREITKTDDDQSYKRLLQKAKKEMFVDKKNQNYLALTNSWIDGKENMEGIFSKYAHGNIPVDKGNILKLSAIVGDILEFYFKK